MNATRRVTRALGVALLLLPALFGAAFAAGPWENLFPPATPDRPRRMVFDTARNRIVAVGTNQYPTQVTTFTPGDSTWQPIATTGAVPTDSWVGYDPARDRLVSLRSSDATLWELPFSTLVWGEISTTGVRPNGIDPNRVTFVDVAADRIVTAGPSSLTYTLTLGGTPTWAPHAPTQYPPSRVSYSAILDSVGNRIIVFGGCVGWCYQSSDYLNDVRALSLSTWEWTLIVPDPALLPTGRRSAAAMYDPVRERMVLFGGELYDGRSKLTNQTWALTLTGTPVWTPLGTASSPSARGGSQAFYEPVGDHMLHVDQQVWAFDLDAPWWTELYPNVPESPLPGYGGVVVADPQLDRLLLTKGTGAVWELTFNGQPWWRELDIPGARPPWRGVDDYGYTTVFDPARRRLILFAGYDGTVCRNDVWEYAVDGGTEWTQIVPLGTPPPVRSWHVAVMDTANDRMIVGFGGCDVQKNDVWELSFAGTPTWTQLAPTGTPPSARQRATAIYDGRRMIVFGGYGQGKRNDTWALSLDGPPAWTEIVASGTLPAPRVNHAAVYDPVADRMTIFAGGTDGPFLEDVWSLPLGVSGVWTHETPAGGSPGAAEKYSAAYDRIRGRMITYRVETWALPLTTPVSAPIPGGAGAEFTLSVSPNPARGAAEIHLRLAESADDVAVDVFDVAGRRVAAVFRGPRGAGPHAFIWRPEARIGAGIYVVRVIAAGGEKTARFVRVK